ncbi:MAG: SRPBCC family protein [Anaerolineae bacterium]
MPRFAAKDQVRVAHSPEAVFDVICVPAKHAELSPLELRIVKGDRLKGVGDTYKGIGEFAARKVECSMRCTVFERPHLLAMEVVGEMEGKEEWQLKQTDVGTEIRLSVDYAAPEWLPVYLRDKTTAQNWANTMVAQTLGNLDKMLGPEAT